MVIVLICRCVDGAYMVSLCVFPHPMWQAIDTCAMPMGCITYTTLTADLMREVFLAYLPSTLEHVQRSFPFIQFRSMHWDLDLLGLSTVVNYNSCYWTWYRSNPATYSSRYYDKFEEISLAQLNENGGHLKDLGFHTMFCNSYHYINNNDKICWT